MKARLVLDARGSLWIYDPPQAGASYVIGADTAEGKIRDRRYGAVDMLDAKDPDFNAASVLDRADGKEVATYLSNYASGIFVQDLILLARHFGTASGCADDAFLVPESNGCGYATVEGLIGAGYYRIYRTRTWNHIGQNWLETVGWRTTEQSRHIMVRDLQNEVRDLSTGVWCLRTAKHMAAMAKDRMGKDAAPPGGHDDLAFARMLAIQGWKGLMASAAPDEKKAEREGDEEYLARKAAEDVDSYSQDRDTVTVEEDCSW